MCQCLSFLAYPCPNISERWASWKLELRRLIARIASYNGPFSGLEVQRISIQGSVTTYTSTGARVHLTVTMGTCMSSSVSTHPAVKHVALSTKRKQLQHPLAQAVLSTTPSAPAKRPRDNIRKGMKEDPNHISCPASEIGLPKKVTANGSSNFACLFSQQGRKGINQDAMIVLEDFVCQEDAVLCGVFDGHGPYGHIVAQMVRDFLPSKLASNFLTRTDASAEVSQQEMSKNDLKENVRADARGSQTASNLFSLWKESFFNAYMLMDKELQAKANLDCFCSGTTAITLVKQGNDVIIGNVGDSRAILGTKSDDGSLIAIPLTVDLKPNLPQEAERIRQCRGRVFALQDEPEVHRVWLPHDNSPGLAMARAFGDFCLKKFGVIAVPEVTHRQLTDKDQFIVLATDGIWDVLSNKEVVDIVSSVTSRPLAARAVVEMAVHAWRSKFPTSKIDDCAVVCLFTKETVAGPPGRNLKKQGLPITPRKRSLSVTAQKSAMVECADRDKVKEVSQKRVLTTKAGITGQPHPHVERSEGDMKAEIDALWRLGDAASSASNQDDNLAKDTEDNEKVNEEAGEEEWSALDGVSRVNSLVNLPRFTPGDARAGG